MGILADQVIMSAGRITGDAFGQITGLADKIKEARRFVLSPDVIATACKLMDSKPSTVVSAIPLCRVPFKNVWMEWDGNVAGRAPLPEGRSETDSAVVPLRFGVLIECFDDTYSRFGLSFAWSHPPTSPDMRASLRSSGLKAALVVCPMGYFVNWVEDWPIMNAKTLLADRAEGVMAQSRWRKHTDIEVERQAALTLMGRATPVAVPHCVKFVEYVRKGSQVAFEQLMQASAFDISGEYLNVMGALCLLNSRNCIEIVKADIETLRRTRRGRHKEPSVSYSTVTINLARKQYEAAKRLGMTEAEIRQHIVRGHFKLRKGGVFWWRPFLRGDSSFGEVRRTGYNIETGIAA